MGRRPVIGVMGGGAVDAATKERAEALGAAIAEAGWTLLNGGRPEGVMAASARGARRAGGLVVGIHPGRPGDETADVDVAVFTGMGDGRNAINILSSDVVVVLPGGAGTLSEAALASKAGRPLVLLGFDDGGRLPDAVRAEDVEACIGAIRQALARP